MQVTPFQRLRNGLLQIRQDTNELLEEALAFTEVMAMKKNSIEVDDDMFYVTAAGPLEEIIPVLYAQLERLERYQKQKGIN
jgi:hypothetical protein